MTPIEPVLLTRRLDVRLLSGPKPIVWVSVPGTVDSTGPIVSNTAWSAAIKGNGRPGSNQLDASQNVCHPKPAFLRHSSPRDQTKQQEEEEEEEEEEKEEEESIRMLSK